MACHDTNMAASSVFMLSDWLVFSSDLTTMKSNLIRARLFLTWRLSQYYCDRDWHTTGDEDGHRYAFIKANTNEQNSVVTYNTLELTYLLLVGIAAQGVGIYSFCMLAEHFHIRTPC